MDLNAEVHYRALLDLNMEVHFRALRDLNMDVCIFLFLAFFPNHTVEIRASCDAALSRLEDVRDDPFRSEATGIIRQMRKRVGSVFTGGSKMTKGVWKHRFYCLAGRAVC